MAKRIVVSVTGEINRQNFRDNLIIFDEDVDNTWRRDLQGIPFDFEEFTMVSEFYDLNAVHVHAGKEAVYGKDAIKEHSKKFIDRTGKLTLELSNEKFDMAGDFIIFTADYEMETEKIGVLKGKFTQIWRKANDSYLILHIEYAPQ